MSPPDDALPEDVATLGLLDAYLQDLHAGRRPDRARVLRERPDLASLLDALESLDRLAIDPPPASPENRTLPLAAPAAPPATGDFGKYELLGELGRGGMGVVWKARQKDLDRIVALKMILGSHLASPEQVERFHHEARAAARLSHPHVVPVYEVGEVHGQHYFAMQYVEGRGLDELLRARPPAAEEAVRLLAPVARAVAYLHEQGVVHRDLKPGNVLIDGQGRPYLADFGLAKLLEGDAHLTGSGTILGTPAYMAPEQAAGRTREVGPLSDVYSLGAILYELLTGRPPFREATPLDTLVQVIEGEPTLPRRLNPQLPRELELICLKCLEKDPQRRYPSAAALADDLERFLHGEAVEARPHSVGQWLLRWARREPALASRLGGLALFTAVIQVNYHLAGGPLLLHLEVLALVAAWALGAWVCQRLLTRRQGTDAVRYVWAGAEPFLLTGLLLLTDNGSGPLLIAYAVLVAGSGLWFRVPLVWFTTAAAEVAFGLLVLGCDRLWVFPHHAVVFAVCLLVLGCVVAHQVRRVRVLSRYCEGRPLP